MEQKYIGLKLKEGIEKAKNEGFTFRLMREDDQRFFGTMDLRLDRLNFETDNGKITKCYVG